MLVTIIWYRKNRKDNEGKTNSSPLKKVRKRDKVLYFGKKVLHKIKGIQSELVLRSHRKQLSAAHLFLKFKQQFNLQVSNYNESDIFYPHDPPSTVFEIGDNSTMVDKLFPKDILLLFNFMKIFGHLEDSMLLKLCNFVSTTSYTKNSIVFSGDNMDSCFYIVKHGIISLFLIDKNGNEHLLKKCGPAESIYSLLNILEIIIGKRHVSYNIVCKASEDSSILRIKNEAFSSMFCNHLDTLIKMLQVILTRLYQVNLCSLTEMFGLTNELLNYQSNENWPHLQIRSIDSESSSSLKKDRNDSSDIDGGINLTFVSSPHHSVFEKNSNPNDKSSDLFDQIMPLCQIFGQSTLKKHLTIDNFITIPPSTCLLKYGSMDYSFYYVIDGQLNIYMTNSISQKENLVKTLSNGDCVGALEVLTGEPSIHTVTAQNICKLVIIKKALFYKILKNNPSAIVELVGYYSNGLSSFVRDSDFAIDWNMFDSGQAVYRSGEEPQYFYYVISGRLRSVIQESNGNNKISCEYGRKKIIGMAEIFRSHKRTDTLLAIRDSQIITFPSCFLTILRSFFPQTLDSLIRLLSSQSFQESVPTNYGGGASDNISTVTLIPASPDVPLLNFALELKKAVDKIGPCVLMQSNSTTLRNDDNVDLSVHEKIMLAQLEETNRMVLYLGDDYLSEWTLRSIRQSDLIIIVALSDGQPQVGSLEREIEKIPTIRAQKLLVLLHQMNENDSRIYASYQYSTASWLKARTWISMHMHIRWSSTQHRSYSARNMRFQNPIPMDEKFGDFARLARRLTGTSIGLVLGGGGARGIAHLGVIRALNEAGIPIDMIGGTSIGSFVGALYADSSNYDDTLIRSNIFSLKMSSIWQKIWDLTYPVVSLFSGFTFNEEIRRAVGLKSVEDLLIPYFCITVDITASKMRIHTTGSLWRYVRASMSLANYLPPMCDPSDNHLLLDGGYVNNLPADVMKAMGASHIIAVDVGAIDSNDYSNYGDHLSGWKILINRWNPFANRLKVPTIHEVQSRLAYIAGSMKLEEIKNDPKVIYIRPPIDNYATLQFSAFDEILLVGYMFAKKLLANKTDLSFASSSDCLKQLINIYGSSNSIPIGTSSTISNISVDITKQWNNLIDFSKNYGRLTNMPVHFSTNSNNEISIDRMTNFNKHGASLTLSDTELVNERTYLVNDGYQSDTKLTQFN